MHDDEESELEPQMGPALVRFERVGVIISGALAFYVLIVKVVLASVAWWRWVISLVCGAELGFA